MKKSRKVCLSFYSFFEPLLLDNLLVSLIYLPMEHFQRIKQLRDKVITVIPINSWIGSNESIFDGLFVRVVSPVVDDLYILNDIILFGGCDRIFGFSFHKLI